MIYLDISRHRKKVPHQGPVVLINPRLICFHGRQWNREGCLSVPDYTADIERHDWIQIEYQTLEGEKSILETDKFESVVVQHEMDHLEGKVFLDRIFSPGTQLFRRVQKT